MFFRLFTRLAILIFVSVDTFYKVKKDMRHEQDDMKLSEIESVAVIFQFFSDPVIDGDTLNR